MALLKLAFSLIYACCLYSCPWVLQDIWVPALVFIANFSALVVGIVRLSYEANWSQVSQGCTTCEAMVHNGDAHDIDAAHAAPASMHSIIAAHLCQEKQET